MLVMALTPPAGAGAPVTANEPVKFGKRTAIPQLPCRPGDRPETDLQGRVPRRDILSGRAAQGYTCNVVKVGSVSTTGFASLDTYRDCAYMSREAGAGGVLVIDASDSRHPVVTDTLVSPAMADPWESMRVNARRGLLVADSNVNSFLDIYDVSKDCRHPQLLSVTNMDPAKGHEGWFSPDGRTYYMSTTVDPGNPSVFPIDISDPTHPRRLASWTFHEQTHGGSTTEDGTRSYVCQQEAPPDDALLVLDTTDVAKRKASPRAHLLASVPLQDNQFCQGVYRVTYGGHPYLIQYGEISGAADCSRSADGWASFAYPRTFDLADERHPKLVGTALLEVDLPQHCKRVQGEGAPGFGFSVHHCSPDRLYNPTILACSYFHAGLRVFDIRNPRRWVEIGYFNPGLHPALGTTSRPVVRADRGEIWFSDDLAGFVIVRFENGIWPFRSGSRCPEYDDYYFTQYNPTSKCRTASFRGVGKPAPVLTTSSPG